MKIYTINTAFQRRVKLINGGLVKAEENVYVFACKNDEEIIMMLGYANVAIARGIDVFLDISKELIEKVDEDGVITLRVRLFQFVIESTESDEWIRGVIKEVLGKD